MCLFFSHFCLRASNPADCPSPPTPSRNFRRIQSGRTTAQATLFRQAGYALACVAAMGADVDVLSLRGARGRGGWVRGHRGSSLLASVVLVLSSVSVAEATDCCTGTSAQGCISDVTFWGHSDPCSDGSYTQGCDICMNTIFGNACTRTGTEYVCYTDCGCIAACK